MASLKINLNNFFFFGIGLCLLLFSIDHKIIYSFRIIDLLIIYLIGLFILTNPKVKSESLVVLCLIILVLLISSLLGVGKKGFLNFSRLGFIYKYFFIFFVPWFIVSVVKTYKQIKLVNRLLLINFIFLSSWAWIYVYLRSISLISGNSRPSFPFGDFRYSDAHLYSSYLSFFLVTYLLYFRKFFNHTFLFSLIIVFNSILGLLMTGSRTGMLILFVFLIIYVFFTLNNFFNFIFLHKITSKKKNINKVLKNAFILIIFLAFAYYYFYEFFALNSYSFQRSLNFNLLNDMSSKFRIEKLLHALNEVLYLGLMLGNGLSSDYVWYDGIFSILIAHGGLILIFFILIFYYLVIKKIYPGFFSKDYLLFIYLCLLYLLTNLITEYILVSRNAFPVLVLLSILFIDLSKKKKARVDF
jgi:hypothetical protein